jgi:hypothetical protein
VLQQRDENACREIEVKAGNFLKYYLIRMKTFVVTRMVTTVSVWCKGNTNITHTSGGFGFRKYVDCRSLLVLHVSRIRVNNRIERRITDIIQSTIPVTR